ncbi:MAG: membrane protein insertion efficiency factor YidD [Acidobacteriota bacterium]|nr:membrane protein insertion efficiency factor YidD [Acidobacteriota bacterium]
MLLAAGILLAGTAAFDMTRPPERQLSVRAAGVLISAYQATVSPLLERAGVHCRFEPTCSEYTRATIRSQGFAAGSLRGLARLVRCGPWTPPGTVDPPTLLAGAPAFRTAPD